MILKKYLLFILIFINQTIIAQTWQPLGPNDFNQAGFSAGQAAYTSLAFNGTTPYVVYQDYGNSNKATVQKFNGASWELVGTAGFSAAQANYTGLAFNGTTPYVVYSDYGNGNGGKVTVQKFNGASWELVGTAGFSAGQASFTCLAFSGTTPYVVYYDGGNSNKATVQKFNGASWELVGTAGFSAGAAFNTSLAFNGTTPYVVYTDEGNSNKATVQKFNGASWEVVGTAGFSAGGAYSTSLAFNGTTPYVVYRDAGNGNKATVQKFNGTIWEVVGTAGFSAGTVDYTSIISTGSQLIVAYSSVEAYAKTFSLATLPVKLTSFDAVLKYKKQVNLIWITASETNNDYFTIEKSSDGKVFEKIATIKSKGNGAAYESIDFNPSEGTSYYKLSQTDVNGKTEELGIKTVKLETLKQESLAVYPNPVVNGIINIQNKELSGLQTLLIYDLSGKQVLKDKVNFINGFVSYKMNIDLPKGTYILSVGDKNLKSKIVLK
jgi:hypothetical protein